MKKFGLGCLFLFCIIMGLGMIEMGWTEPTYQMDSRIFMTVCGLIFVVAGVLATMKILAPFIGKRDSMIRILTGKGTVTEGVKDAMRGVLIPDFRESTSDLTRTEDLIRSFRGDCAKFFEERGVGENAALQKDATQILWHMFSLQKKRLDEKNITLQMNSKRWKYGDAPSVSEENFFDGKYEITQVTETVCAEKVFLKDQKMLSKYRTTDVAKYRLLHAKTMGKKEILCPNCGNVSTRENLMDGCDYCGTKFAVEDLGTRVSDFSLQKDEQLEYEKYRSCRETYSYRVGVIVGIPVGLLNLAGMILTGLALPTGIFMKLTVILLGTSFLTFAAVFFALCLFYLLVFPLIQGGKMISIMSRQQVKAWQQRSMKDREALERIQTYDSLFSLEGFSAELGNQLATIHYAGNAKAATVFAAGERAIGQISERVSEYASVIDMRIESIHLDKYENAGGMQKLDVTAVLSLLTEEGKSSREKLHLTLEKEAACKTQAICAPYVLKCEGCGSSLTMLDGLTCDYCNKKVDLKKIDWVITDYLII